MSQYSFWLLKPHQKPVACQFEITEGTGVRLLRGVGGGQLFKFTFEKIVKWNLGRDPNFLELQIQIGRSGPAGSLKFQVKDGTTTDDINYILGVITRCKGGDGGESDSREKAGSTHEKTNVARKKEAEDIKKASNETMKKIQNERKQQSMRLQQANVTVETPKKSSVDLKNRMAHHKKSIQKQVEMKRSRSFVVTSKAQADVPVPSAQSQTQSQSQVPAPAQAAGVERKVPRKKSSRTSIYALASSKNVEVEDDGVEFVEDKQSASPAGTVRMQPSGAFKRKARQPSGIMPAPKTIQNKSNLHGLSAIGESAEEEAPAPSRSPAPPPPARRSVAAPAPSSQSRPPPPPPASPSPAKEKKMSLVQARRSMYQQKDEESLGAMRSISKKGTRSSRSRSPSPSPKQSPPPSPATASTASIDQSIGQSQEAAGEENVVASAPPPAPVPSQEAPQSTTIKTRRPSSVMTTPVDASKHPDLAEAKSMISMLKMEVQREKDRSSANEKKLLAENESLQSELQEMGSKYENLVKENEVNLKDIVNLKKEVETEKRKNVMHRKSIDRDVSQSQGGDADEEKENLLAENSQLVQSEALLLRSVMESSDTLGALSNRLWQVCEKDDDGDHEDDHAKEHGDSAADADMSALRVTIASLSRAVEAMESEKHEKDDELHQLKKKLKKEQSQKHKMEEQIREEGEVTSALMDEAQTAANEGEDMRAMMEEFKRIAEERTEGFTAAEEQREEAMKELASVTRELDLLRNKVDEQVEEAIAKERTKSVAHLKSELSKEKQKYEQMLEEILRDEEERSKMEESQAELIENQVAEALKQNEVVLQERLQELEAEFKAKLLAAEQGAQTAGSQDQGDAVAAQVSESSEPSVAKNALEQKVSELEKELAASESKAEKLEGRVKGMASEIHFLSARTSSAYTAVESFVEHATHFNSATIEEVLRRSEQFAATLQRESDQVLETINTQLVQVEDELELRLPFPQVIEMVPSTSEEDDSLSVTKGSKTASPVPSVPQSPRPSVSKPQPSARSPRSKLRKSSARRSSAPAPAIANLDMVPVDLAVLSKDVEVKTMENIKMLDEDSLKKADLAALTEQIQRGIREELTKVTQNEQDLRGELEHKKDIIVSLTKELEEAKEDLEEARANADDADKVCQVVESQCRTLALELAAQRLESTSSALTSEEDTDANAHRSPLVSGSQPQSTRRLVVVPVDLVGRDSLPSYTLLELSERGMSLGENEVALSRKASSQQGPDFPWERVNQITVGIADEYVSLDLFEHAHAEAVSLRIRDVRHLNAVLTLVTKRRIEAALASTSTASTKLQDVGDSGLVSEGVDFGLNVTRVCSDPFDNLSKRLVEEGKGQQGSILMNGGDTSMSPAVVRISSVSRGLARTHANLKRRLLNEGLLGSPRGPTGGLGAVREEGEEREEGGERVEEGDELSEENVRSMELETEREMALSSKVASLEAVRNDLVHKLASCRVSAVNAVMQSHNVVKFLANASRSDMTEGLLEMDNLGGTSTDEKAKEEEENDTDNDDTAGDMASKFGVPSWKPVTESVKNLLTESISWSASELGNKADDFSFGMNEAEREAFLVAQAEAELTQSAVNCLESLWKDRVGRLQAQLDLTQKKGEESQDHESTLLQDLASSRASEATLQEELTFARKELQTLKHVYESQESIAAVEHRDISLEDRVLSPGTMVKRLEAPRAPAAAVSPAAALSPAPAAPAAPPAQSSSLSPAPTVSLVISPPVSKSKSAPKSPSPAKSKSVGKLSKDLVASGMMIKAYDYRLPKARQSERAPETSEVKEASVPSHSSIPSNQQQIILANYEDIQSRQQQLSNEVIETVENLKNIDDRLTELDQAASFIGDKVESYFDNLSTMEESYDRNKIKLGEIEQEIYEQDVKIAQVKASVASTQEMEQKLNESITNKKVSISKTPVASPLSEIKENSSGEKKAQHSRLPLDSYPVSTPPASPPEFPFTPKSNGKASLSVKAKKLENVVQNIMNLIG